MGVGARIAPNLRGSEFQRLPATADAEIHCHRKPLGRKVEVLAPDPLQAHFAEFAFDQPLHHVVVLRAGDPAPHQVAGVTALDRDGRDFPEELLHPIALDPAVLLVTSWQRHADEGLLDVVRVQLDGQLPRPFGAGPLRLRGRGRLAHQHQRRRGGHQQRAARQHRDSESLHVSLRFLDDHRVAGTQNRTHGNDVVLLEGVT